MSKVQVASLSDLGWVTSPDTTLALLLGYFILTDAAQSISFQNNLTSLPEIYYNHINNPDEMASALRSSLGSLLSRYFGTVEVEVATNAVTEKRYGILLYVSVLTDEGFKVSLGRVVDLDSTGVRKVIEVNNYGDGASLLSSM